MKYYDNKMWLRLQDLIDWGIPHRTLHNTKNDLETLEDGGVFIAYDSLRASWQEKIQETLGCSPWEFYRYKLIDQDLRLKVDDLEDIEQYTLPDGTKLSQEAKQTAKKACQFLCWIGRGKMELNKYLLQKLQDFWGMARGYVKLRGLDLPSSRKLESKWLEYLRCGAEAVIPKRYGKRNAAKVNQVHIELLTELMADGRKFSKREVMRQFRAIAAERGWEEVTAISDSALYLYINSRAGYWEAERHGAKWFMLNRQLVINQRRASQPHAQWQADGTPAALWYKDEDGNIGKLYVLTIMDSHSFSVVGYAIGETENTALVAEGLKIAMKTQGKKPWELRTDKGSAFSNGETKSLLNNLGITWKPTGTGRARAKSIEVMQGWWMRRITIYYANKSGMNLNTTTEDSRMNQDYFKANKELLPDKQGLVAQIRESLAIWNNTKGEDGRTPSERLQDPCPGAKTVDAGTMVEQFGLWRKKGKKLVKYQFGIEGLEMQVGGQIFRYLPIADTEKAQAALLQKIMFTEVFYVKYDPTDVETISLYILPSGEKEEEEKLRFWGYAELKHLSAQVWHEAKEQEKSAFKKQRTIQSEQTNWIKEEGKRRKALLEAENVLSGAVSLERVQKDALNAAKLELQRLEALGYDHSTAETERKTQSSKSLSINIYRDRYED